MKRIVRLNENDLSRIVKRVIRESEEALVDEIDVELDSVDENNPDPGVLERIVNKIQDAGHDVEMFIKKLRRNRRKLEMNLRKKFKRSKLGKWVRNNFGGMNESFNIPRHRELQYLLKESEDALVDEIDSALDSMDENSPEPNPLQMLIDKIEDAGHDVEDFIKKLRRNARKFRRKLSRTFRNLRFKRKKPIFAPNQHPGSTEMPKW
jgi:hypothetical protein